MKCNRRTWFSRIGSYGTALFGLLSSVGHSGCVHYQAFRARLTPHGRIAIPRHALSPLVSPENVLRVEVDHEPVEIHVRRIHPRDDASSYLALIPICTHRNCHLTLNPDGYDCPCHGSSFTLEGNVVTGPADRPLRRLNVAMNSQGLELWSAANVP